MKPLTQLADALDRLIDLVGWVAAGVTLVMVLLISGNTLMRYFFNTSAIWAQELEWHLLAFIALWGLAYMQLRAVPVRVDMFYQHYSARAKLALDFGVALLVILPFSLFVCWLGWGFVAHSYALNEVSPDPGGLPLRWIVKSFVIAGYALLALAALSQIIRLGLQWFTGQQARHGL
jgi:TRAP-type mannitol/chloroaromatic compound transport system permease small subunit